MIKFDYNNFPPFVGVDGVIEPRGVDDRQPKFHPPLFNLHRLLFNLHSFVHSVYNVANEELMKNEE